MPATREIGATRVGFGEYELDLRTRELHKNGRAILLQPQVFVALATLLERPGEVVTRDRLRQAIWPTDTFVDFDRGLNAVMRRVRQAVRDDADQPCYIETLPRIGYRFIGSVRTCAQQAPVHPLDALPTQTAANSVSTGAQTRRLPKTLGVLAAAAALLFVISAGRTISSAVQRKQQAQRAYQMGLYELAKWTPDDLGRSAAYFEQAVSYDEGNAAAWAGLARSYTLLGTLQLAPPLGSFQKAKTAALKAVERNAASADAHTAMAGVLMSEWSWTMAEHELQRALGLDPNDADTHQLYGYWLVTQSHMREAIEEMRRADGLEPHSANKRNSLAAALFYARQFDDALAIWRETRAVEANTLRRHQRLAFVYEAKGMPIDSVAEMVAVLRKRDRAAAASNVERVFITRGYDAARQAFYRTEIDNDSEAGGEQYQLAADYVAIAEHDRALQALNRSVAARETSIIYLGVDPRFDALHGDVRFDAIVRTVGIGGR